MPKRSVQDVFAIGIVTVSRSPNAAKWRSASAGVPTESETAWPWMPRYGWPVGVQPHVRDRIACFRGCLVAVRHIADFHLHHDAAVEAVRVEIECFRGLGLEKEMTDELHEKYHRRALTDVERMRGSRCRCRQSATRSGFSITGKQATAPDILASASCKADGGIDRVVCAGHDRE
jgi:hypothetical protein